MVSGAFETDPKALLYLMPRHEGFKIFMASYPSLRPVDEKSGCCWLKRDREAKNSKETE